MLVSSRVRIRAFVAYVSIEPKLVFTDLLTIKTLFYDMVPYISDNDSDCDDITDLTESTELLTL